MEKKEKKTLKMTAKLENKALSQRLARIANFPKKLKDLNDSKAILKVEIGVIDSRIAAIEGEQLLIELKNSRRKKK